MLKESLRMSWNNIKSNKMRTFLTMLGIIIGVTAIIALITTVEGATNEMTSQFASLGAGKVTVNIIGTPLKRGLTQEDIDRIAAVDNIAGVDPGLSFTRHIASNGQLLENVSIEGHGAAYFSDASLIGQGRGLTPIDMDRYSNVCIINGGVKSALFPNEDAIGQELVIAGITFRVVGMTDDNNDNDMMRAMTSMSNASTKGTVMIPYPAAMRVMHRGSVSSMTLYIGDTDRTNNAIQGVKDVLNAAFNYRDDAYRVINLDSLLDTMNQITGMMTTMLVGIASIALLVGGIGIMNMMLVSVSERTMEIGLRKALGAKPVLIQVQFLMESILLSLMGGTIGILVGNLVSWIIALVVDIPFVMSPGAIGLAFGFSATVGILFGWAPARKASQLNPIDALRSM